MFFISSPFYCNTHTGRAKRHQNRRVSLTRPGQFERQALFTMHHPPPSLAPETSSTDEAIVASFYPRMQHKIASECYPPDPVGGKYKMQFYISYIRATHTLYPLLQKKSNTISITTTVTCKIHVCFGRAVSKKARSIASSGKHTCTVP